MSRDKARYKSLRPLILRDEDGDDDGDDAQAQDKHEQLSELLTSYTLHGLPKMPDCLTRGRPHYDQSAFTLSLIHI